MRRQVFAVIAFIALLAIQLPELQAGSTFTFTLDPNYTTPVFGVADLLGGAGTDFASSSWESATNAAELEVKNSSSAWEITVRKVDIDWDAPLKLYVKRTGTGGGPGTVTGGATYQEITGTAQLFFSCTADKKNIPLQYQITGITVALGAATFSTTVYYTVTEI